MELRFKQFRFDCEQQILTDNGKVVALNDKALKLLVILLEQPEKVHSKSDILNRVWGDRVVSDQVVFQNVSRLRTLFGNDAIKTFSKKGYQWQLPLCDTDHAEPNLLSPDHSVEENQATEIQLTDGTKNAEQQLASRSEIFGSKTHNNKLLKGSIFASLLLCFLLFIGWFNLNTSVDISDIPKVALVHIDQQERLTIDELDSVSSQRLFDSPYEAWHSQTLSNSHWLISHSYFELENGHGLRFHIQGEKRGWSDYIFADSRAEAEDRFLDLLAKLATTDFFNLQLKQAAIAELTVLHSKYPNDELVSQALARQYLLANQLESAKAQINNLLDGPKSELENGLRLLFRAKVLAEVGELGSSKKDAERALSVFAQLGLPHLEAETMLVLSWFYMENQQFLEGIQVLNRAVSKARTSGEKLLELKILLTQSTMAAKSKQQEMAISLIDLSKQIIDLHALDKIHNSPINEIEARFSTSKEQKLGYLLANLELPYSPTYESYFYKAARQARDIFIENKDWQGALAVQRPWQRSSFVSLSKGRVAIAQQNWPQASLFIQQAFQEAELNADKVDGLNAALELIQYSQEFNIETDKYSQYILREATTRWLSLNRVRLTELEVLQ